MLLVGLTGNIASGKSEVARIFARHGATVIDADALARDAVRPGMPAYRDIVSRWGPAVLLPDESIDRDALRGLVFNDAAARDQLDAIVHPRVRAMRAALLKDARHRGDAVVICAIPLLFETGMEGEFDRIVLVDAPESVRLARLKRTRGLTDDEARRMIAAQMPVGRKRTMAHAIIDNDGSLDALAQRAEEVWLELTART
jgi:dephospho-CoA kinase